MKVLAQAKTHQVIIFKLFEDGELGIFKYNDGVKHTLSNLMFYINSYEFTKIFGKCRDLEFHTALELFIKEMPPVPQLLMKYEEEQLQEEEEALAVDLSDIPF